MNLPAVTDRPLEPAQPEETRAALRALFAQFPAADGDQNGRILGYLMALEGEPKWAIDAAVRRFLTGAVSSHDGRFCPSSAELARVVREETAYRRRMEEREERSRRLAIAPIINAPKPRVVEGFKKLSDGLAAVIAERR